MRLRWRAPGPARGLGPVVRQARLALLKIKSVNHDEKTLRERDAPSAIAVGGVVEQNALKPNPVPLDSEMRTEKQNGTTRCQPDPEVAL